MLPCEAIYATSDSAFYANKKKTRKQNCTKRMNKTYFESHASFLASPNTTTDPWATLLT